MEDAKKSWADYYAGHQRNLSNIILHYPYLFSIFWCRPKTLLEIGCGSADHSMFLKKWLPKLEISFLDNDEIILENARVNNANHIANSYLVNILDGKAVHSIPYFDAVISQGLMEHFADDEFIRIISNFRSKAGNFIFSIPSNFYPTRDFGNEILRSKREIVDLIKQIPDTRYSVSGYFDIGLKTKFVGIPGIKGIYQKLKYFFFSSNHILVKVTYLETDNI